MNSGREVCVTIFPCRINENTHSHRPTRSRHGLHSLGWWVAEKKDADGHDQSVSLLAGESVEMIQKSIGAFHKDAEWQRVEKGTEKDGKLRSGVEALKLTPTNFAALR